MVALATSPNSLSGIPVYNVPQGWGTYLQIYDRIRTYTGTALYYDKTGYKGQTGFYVNQPNIIDADSASSGAGGDQSAPLFQAP